MKRCALIVLTLLALAALSPPARAEAPSFTLPVDCRIGETCWIVNYVDAAAADNEARDFNCGPRTYDAHKGTDFAVPDMVAMEMGTPVLAAADGTVLRLRDDVEDKIPTEDEIEEIKAANRECGNGVFIDHGGGWQTIYCHMKRGSITVKPGQKIKAGTKIGLVGNSGIAEFPHVHFGVFLDGRPVDPFTGPFEPGDCGASGTSLWNEALALQYEPAIIFRTGFKAGQPDIEALKIDTYSPSTVPKNAEALTYWAGFYGVAKGDEISFTIIGPDGKPFTTHAVTQDKDRARQYYYMGRRAPGTGLEPGTYTGHVRLVRHVPGKADIVRENTASIIVQ